MIIDQLSSVLEEHIVFIQKIQKYGSRYPFISIRKNMVLRNKI